MVTAIDHWIAFGLLSAAGVHMLFAAFSKKPEEEEPGSSFLVLIATAIGTSLDAMAVGVSLAFLNVNILVIAVAIGLATFVMSSGGMIIGRFIGVRLGRIAEAVAGIALFGLGLSILIDHLGA